MALQPANGSEQAPSAQGVLISSVRRRAKPIDAKTRAALISAYDGNGDWRAIARILDVNVNTAYRICKSRKLVAEKRGRKTADKVTAEITAAVVAYVEAHPAATLAQIKEAVSSLGDLSVSTVYRVLDGQLITVKKLDCIPAVRNAHQNKQRRAEFAHFLRDEGANYRCVLVDETGYNLYTTRTFGRAKRGRRARKTMENQRGGHITLIAAVSPEGGLMHSQFISGGCKAADFDKFLQQLATRLSTSEPGLPWMIFYDNAPCHSSADRICDELSVGHRRLPPYSCELNAIEYCFQPFKSSLKRALAEVQIEQHEGETLTSARKRVLLELGEGCLQSITLVKVMRSYMHVLQSVAPRAERMEDL